MKIIVYKNGDYQLRNGASWEEENNPDWLTTIELKKMDSLIKYLANERNPNVYACMNMAFDIASEFNQ